MAFDGAKAARWLAPSILGLVGLVLARNAVADPALAWMHVYAPSDFERLSAARILRFMAELRAPIPPAIALAEIASIKLVGTTALVTEYGYRLAMVGSFVLAVVLAGTSWRRTVASAAVSLVFLYATTLIHPGNPSGYDLFYPLFLLAHLVTLRRAAAVDATAWGAVAWPALAGVFLTLTELTRPFVIVLLPLFLVGAALAFRPQHRRRRLLALAVPVVLVSGGWHTHLLTAHGLWTASNNTGFGLVRGWPQIPFTTVPLTPDLHNHPLRPGRWPNLNTTERIENSRRLQRAARAYWAEHPWDSFLYVNERVGDLLSGHVDTYAYHPESQLFGVYRLLVLASAGWVVWGLTRLALRLARARRREAWADALSHPDHVLLGAVALSVVILAAGERGEEARFLVSVLPLLAALPALRPEARAPREAPRGEAVLTPAGRGS